jgi:glycosyltransferase involved in cell wall biosynthesis
MFQNLKVAYLLGTFPQRTQTFVTREIFWIGEHGVDTHIFSLNKPESIPEDKLAKKLYTDVHYSSNLSWDIIKAQFYYFFRMPSNYLLALIRTILYTYSEPSMLLRALVNFPKSVYFARQMEELKVDHIHAHFITLAAISASIISLLIETSFSLTAHAVGLFKRSRRSVRRQLQDATRVVTISNYHRDHIADLCPKIKRDDIGIVYCGLDTNHFQPVSKNPGDGPIRILSVGRLIEKKGFEYLVDACSVIAKSGLSFQCDIVGDGPLQELLQTRINHHGLNEEVTLLGSLDQDHILELYQKSDIFVLACVVANNGNRDGLPVVLMEAMSSELPVITTPVTGIVDLAEHGQNSLLVEERNVFALAEAIMKVIKDEKLRIQLGKQGREKVIKDFRVQTNTARLADIFEKIAVSNNKQS